MFLNSKMKENCLPQPKDHPKTLSPAHLKSKTKNSKEGAHKISKIQKDMPVIPIKRQPHRPSKSSVQSQQHKHYNSPNPDISHPSENSNINQFTFTQLLKQNQEHPLPITSRTIISLHQPAASPISDPSLKFRESMMRKTPLTGYGLTQTNPSFIQEGDPNRKEAELSKEVCSKTENTSGGCGKSENKLNSHKSVSKSPVRLTNAHKLNNTPKLKERPKKNVNDYDNKASSKTFKSILNSEETHLQNNHVKQESLNLLCSEKINKFLENNPLEKESTKHKSNLQSTGILYLSQPYQGQKSPPFCHPSSSKLEINRIISQSNPIQQFQDQEPVQVLRNHLTCRIGELKGKMNEISSYLQNKLQIYSQAAFEDYISSNFNPELQHQDVSTLIATLIEVSFRINLIFNEIVDKVQRSALLFQEKIQEQVEILRNSQQSLIDWHQVEQSLDNKLLLQNQLFKTDVLSIRLEELQKKSIKISLPEDLIGDDYIEELNSITNELNVVVKKLSLVDNGKEKQTSFGQSQVDFFKFKTNQLQNLLQYLDQLLTL